MLPSLIGGPTTREVGFFACDQDRLTSWLIAGLDGAWSTSSTGWRTLNNAVESLAPSPVLSRYAAIQTDGWAVLLNNSPNGTDVGVLPSYAARELGCRAIRAACTDDDGPGYPGRILEIYGPNGMPPLSLERSVIAANDGGRWVFETTGSPFPFEDQEAYKRRTKARRFTSEMLRRYLLDLGVPAEAEPNWSGAVVIERTG